MKHIYKFSIVLLAVFTFIGCNVDDDDAVTVLPMKELTASLSQQVDIIGVPDDATSYDLVISFSEALPSYSTIEYSLDGGATTSSSASTGDDTLVISIPFNSNDDFHDINLSDFIVVNASARNFTTSISGSTSARLMRQGYFSAKMTWGTNQDLDLDLDVMTSSWGWGGTTLDSSAGVTNEENVSARLQDGNYALYVFEWPTSSFSQPADLTFDIVTAGGNYNFTVNAEDVGWHIWFTKSTDGDGNVSYIMYTEDPS
tara:strand:- start:7276 stop:8046 length:771 start_codon:yes stop_codon:yes gene_type:complete